MGDEGTWEEVERGSNVWTYAVQVGRGWGVNAANRGLDVVVVRLDFSNAGNSTQKGTVDVELAPGAREAVGVLLPVDRFLPVECRYNAWLLRKNNPPKTPPVRTPKKQGPKPRTRPMGVERTPFRTQSPLPQDPGKHTPETQPAVPPRPPENLEVCRARVEPDSVVVVVGCRLNKNGSNIGFEVRNGGDEDGQVTIDFTNAKNCKVVPFGDLVEGKVITAKVAHKATRTLALVAPERHGMWDWDHSLSWLPHTGESSQQAQRLGEGVTLMKQPAGGLWDFILINNRAGPLDVAIDFTKSNNIKILPKGRTFFQDKGMKSLRCVVPGGEQAGLCRVGPNDASRGWAWGYQVSYHLVQISDEVSSPAKDKLPPSEMPVSSETIDISTTGKLYLSRFDDTQVHCVVSNTSNASASFAIAFKKTPSVTYINAQPTGTKAHHNTFFATLPAKSQCLVAVAMCKPRHFPEVSTANVNDQ